MHESVAVQMKLIVFLVMALLPVAGVLVFAVLDWWRRRTCQCLSCQRRRARTREGVSE
ncbi:MAG: hypothetical protein HQ559_04265 [Lentisphaerae bacterium]|nr:hypothetical protein [Lentisphaerota bacterium]